MASRFPPRDRSPPPPRYGDRGPPPPHGPSHIPSGPRGNEDANSTPLGRDPPRGPKALIDSSRGGHFLPSGPRGRGFPGRNDFRDRDRDRGDPRDLRDGPPPRRGDGGDRDWPRRDRGFDSRDGHGRMGFGRGRSRSPPMRDFRDSRDNGPRELDIPRLRRNSRDGPITLNTALSDIPPMRGGSMRGRGRGDRDRGRGRGMPLDERDLFRGRSRSRDGWRESRIDRDRERNRDPRDRDRDRERMIDRDVDRRDRFDRRDDDRWSQRDDRDRFERAEPWKKDRPLARIDTKTPTVQSGNPSSAVSQTPTLLSLGASGAGVEEEAAAPRKASSTSSTPRESRRPSEKIEHVTPIRTPTHVQSTPVQPDLPSERPTPQFSPSPAAPEVPAFGSLSGASAASTEVPANEPLRKLTQTSASQQPDVPKERPDLFPSTPIKPPTAPRADRIDAQQRSDRSKTDVSLRSSRPPTASPVVQPSYMLDHSHPVPSLDRITTQESVPQPGKPRDVRALSTTEQEPDLFASSTAGFTGPSHTGSSTRASSLPTQPQPTQHKSPPPPQSLTSLSPNIQPASIPTGPRAQQQRPSGQRPGTKGSNQWVRPGYVNRRLSATNSPPSKRELWDEGNRRLTLESPFAPEEVHNGSGNVEEEVKLPITPANGEEKEEEKEKDVAKPSSKLIQDREEVDENEREPSPSEEPDKRTRDADNDTTMLDAPEVQETKETPKTQEEPEEQIPILFDESSDQQSDDDALDEEDFNQSEIRFEKEMQVLKSEIPPPILQDPVVVDLLLRVQMLAMIADGAAPAYLDQPGAAIEVESADKPTAIIPLSGKEAEEIELAEESRHVATSNGTAVAIPAIEPKAVDSLPFLPSGPPTPFSDMETLQENFKLHDRIKDSLLEDIIKQRSEIAKQHASLREQYARHYKTWRLKVREMDRKKEQERKADSRSSSTPPPPLAVTTTVPIIEGRRGYKLNSELDFQLALKASAITAQEESERRRDQEATVNPDMTREARIPDMLDEYQKKASLFQDTNQIVDPADAFTVFAFHPPPNDFTPEEHKAFTDAFMAHPKKWGKIAELLPGRTFQQCVMHYYSTKEDIKYKAKLNKKWTRKGRARKTARAPKSNALMADLGIRPAYDADDTETPVVTDTGRPRRAAAPTFGDSNADTESNTPTPASGKRGAGKDSSDQPSERGPGRRPGRGGGGGRGGRRGRGGGQQGGARAETGTSTTTTTAAAASCANTVPAVAPLPKPETEGQVESVMDAMVKTKDEMERPPEEAAVRTKPVRGVRNKEQQQLQQLQQGQEAADADAKGLGEGGYGSLQPTSYWSVPEQRDFPELVAHFGKDFDAISQFMKTKTPTMVKNYFQRRVDSGKTELEEAALIAEAKKIRGEPTGPLPIPSVSSKRRYEATPSSVAPRALAPNMDNADVMDRTLAPKGKPSGINMPPAPAVLQPRQGMEKERSQPKLYPLVQAPASQPNLATTSDELHQRSVSTSQLPPSHRNQQGPRMGYFTDEWRDGRPSGSHVNIAAHMQEQDVKPMPHSLSGQAPPGMPLQTLQRQNPNAVPQIQDLGEIPRYAPLSQPPTFPQGSYLQPPGSVRNTSASRSHSRRSSRTIPSSAATSPAQRHIKLDTDPAGIAAMERPAPMGPSGYLPPGHPASVGRQGPTLTPPTDHGRPRIATASAAPEPPRHVPAKRSNIMNILNDEPEEPQPRKRFASEQTTPSVAAAGSS
ncbi:MYB DNA-binding domain protein [Arthroderma uncinatum]|uniref:MYB DNA-binding domain protein n=1 Tax=Arthroderma uncinatum TaxID=74035 RepID=UPI00144AAFE5|nr:MYB DNA-binding domain protein [Arthroderma uncinatum]KAF3479618.1 MYB DNA-binding domain protein [Arthroderma uncinatum]